MDENQQPSYLYPVCGINLHLNEQINFVSQVQEW